MRSDLLLASFPPASQGRLGEAEVDAFLSACERVQEENEKRLAQARKRIRLCAYLTGARRSLLSSLGLRDRSCSEGEPHFSWCLALQWEEHHNSHAFMARIKEMSPRLESNDSPGE